MREQRSKTTKRKIIGINIMLAQVLKKYQTSKKGTQKILQSLKQTIEYQLELKTIQALKIQNHKVSKIHSNQQEIQNRLRKNNQLQGQLKIHLGGWILLYDELNKTLKEAGDVAHYARYVQEQIKQISQQLVIRMNNDKNSNNNGEEKKKFDTDSISRIDSGEREIKIEKQESKGEDKDKGPNNKKEEQDDQFFDIDV